MTFYTPSVAVDPIQGTSVISQPTSQALVLANPNAGMQYQTSAMTIPTGRNSYAYGSYAQPVQYGYPQSMPMYVQPRQQVVYTMPGGGYNMPNTYPVSGYGGYGMPMTSQYGASYVPGMGGASVIVQDPYGSHYRRKHRRHRRYSSGYYPQTYGYGYGY